MSLVAFTLSMPGVGSWDGRWSGTGRLYVVVRQVSNTRAKELDSKSFSYQWNDGWCAAVEARIVRSDEARKLRRQSAGFYGYDWMVERIIQYDKILNDAQIMLRSRAATEVQP